MPITHELKSPCIYRSVYPSEEELKSDELKDKVVLAPAPQKDGLLRDINRFMGMAKIGETTILELRMKDLKFDDKKKTLVRLTQTDIKNMKLNDIYKLSPPDMKMAMANQLNGALHVIPKQLDELSDLNISLGVLNKNSSIKKLEALQKSLNELKNSTPENNLEKLEKSKKALAELKTSLEELRKSSQEKINKLDKLYSSGDLDGQKKPETLAKIRKLEKLMNQTALTDSSILIDHINQEARTPMLNYREDLANKTKFKKTHSENDTDNKDSFDTFLKKHLLNKIDDPEKKHSWLTLLSRVFIKVDW